MAAPVWVLSVDLQTKTATFQSGLADAAKAARGSFSDIKSGASEMGGHVNVNMFAARHSVMALSEAFGGQLPRAITAFIAHLGPVGPALEAAFPFAAIGLGAVLLIEHLAKIHAEGQKLTEDQIKFGTTAQTVFNSLNEKLLQAGIKTDELRNNHIGALHKELQLIDRQSMDELMHTFGELAKSADVVFADLKTSWYQFGIGSAGAKHALDEFQSKYDSLLAQGKDKEATDLLRGTRESAQKVLDLQKQAQGTSGAASGSGDDNRAKLLQHEAALTGLKASGVGFTEKEVAAQQALVDSLNAQVSVESKVAALKGAEKGNASLSTGKELSAMHSAAEKEAAEHAQRMGEISLGAQKQASEAALSMEEAGVIARLQADVHLANEQFAIESEGIQARIGALDKGGKDYANQLKALNDKAEELTAQHAAALADLGTKAQTEQFRRDVAAVEQAEREKIEATDSGSKERLAAIDAAMKEEQSRGLITTEFYRNLSKERVQVERQADAEASKAAAEAGKEEAANEEKMGELSLAAAREKQALADSGRRLTIQQRIQEELTAANQEFAVKQAAMDREIAALDKGGKDYENKLREMQNKERQLVQQHENELTTIRDSAEQERNQKILSAENRLNDSLASGLSQVLMGHKSFASMMNSLGDQVVSGMMENAIKSILAHEMTKETDAAAAARAAYLSGVEVGGPAGLILGPEMGAAAFASMMAFQSGTDSVPGIGIGDTVPAMLEPGEGVVPGGVMDGLRSMARSGQMGGGNHFHANVSPTYHLHALDTQGMEKMLNKHNDTIQKHVSNELRKMSAHG